MYYLRVPDPQEYVDNNGQKATFGWDELHEEVVWGHEVWRSGSADAMRAYDEVESKCLGAAPRSWIALTDGTYEIYVSVATARDKRLGGKAQRAMYRIMRSIMEATTTKPEDFDEAA